MISYEKDSPAIDQPRDAVFVLGGFKTVPPSAIVHVAADRI
jgi:hypothetical protein